MENHWIAETLLDENCGDVRQQLMRVLHSSAKQVFNGQRNIVTHCHAVTLFVYTYELDQCRSIYPIYMYTIQL